MAKDHPCIRRLLIKWQTAVNMPLDHFNIHYTIQILRMAGKYSDRVENFNKAYIL